MKYNMLKRWISIGVGLGILYSQEGFGQKIRFPTSTTSLKSSIISIQGLKDTVRKYIPSALFEIKLDSVLNTVNGIASSSGNASLSSTTVDDKGLTFNLNLLEDEKYGNLQITAAGQSTKGTIDLFSGGKYSKTISGGFNYFYFPSNNMANFEDSDKVKLEMKLDRIIKYFDFKIQKDIGLSDLDSIISIFNTYGRYIYTQSPIPESLIKDYDKKHTEFLALLKRYKQYFPKDFESIPPEGQQKVIDELKNKKNDVFSNFLHQKELDSLNVIQLAVQYSSTRYNWYALNGKINNSKYPLYDATSTKNLFTKTLNDYYFSFSLSYNILWINARSNFWVYPTIKFQNSRIFNSGDLVYLDIPQGSKTINNQQVNEYKQTSYYNKEANRTGTINAELPLVIFFPKNKFGLDIAVNSDVKPSLKNVGGRIGFYLSLPTGKQSIIIEPLIRVTKLEQNNLSFTNEQLSFGFNVTVTLPEFVTGKRNKL